MKAVLVGPLASISDIRRTQSELVGALIVAVDHGLDLCWKAGFLPDFAVGDWDSLRDRKLLRRVTHLTLPPRKDRSDLEFALGAARTAGATEFHCIGLTGGKLDYHLANLYDLAQARGCVTASDEHAYYRFLSPRGAAKITFGTRKGERFSVLPLSGSASGVSISGAEYPLRNATLSCSSHGLSNRATGTRVSVSRKKGKLVVVTYFAQPERS